MSPHVPGIGSAFPSFYGGAGGVNNNPLIPSSPEFGEGRIEGAMGQFHRVARSQGWWHRKKHVLIDGDREG